MASILENRTQESKDEKDSQESSNKASYLKSDAEFKKIFGLTKDLRVCLTPIPDHLGPGKDFDYFSSLVKSGTYKETEFVVKEEENKQVITDFKVSFIGTTKIRGCVFLICFSVLCG